MFKGQFQKYIFDAENALLQIPKTTKYFDICWQSTNYPRQMNSTSWSMSGPEKRQI